MKRLILHVGMPKTGTSSIQETLYYGLNDPRFHYLGFGQINGSRAVEFLFGFTPESFYLNDHEGIDSRDIRRLKLCFQQRMERSIQAAERRGACLILSAEHCWNMKRQELADLALFFRNRGYAIRVIAYVRPWKGWLESRFQQMVQIGLGTFEPLPSEQHPKRASYVSRIRSLDHVFGRENVNISIFDPRRLASGCVVTDFCIKAGIPMPPRHIHRVNDGLSLEAIRLLYTYRHFGGRFGTSRWERFENEDLIRRLSSLPGPRLRFHSVLLEPWLPFLEQEYADLAQRMGTTLRMDLAQNDDQPCIRREDDLFRFSESALAWLACQLGENPLPAGARERTGRAVAAQMERLRRRPRLSSLARSMGDTARRLWRHHGHSV